jgi:hypothetical protein
MIKETRSLDSTPLCALCTLYRNRYIRSTNKVNTDCPNVVETKEGCRIGMVLQKEFTGALLTPNNLESEASDWSARDLEPKREEKNDIPFVQITVVP